MAAIAYTLLFVCILLMPCTADDEVAFTVETPLGEAEVDGSEDACASSCPGAGSCPAKITIEDRLDVIVAVIDVTQELLRNGERNNTESQEMLKNMTESLKQDVQIGQEMFINVTESLKQDVLTAQKLILSRVEEVENKLTEKCRLDAHCKSEDKATIPKVYKDCQAWVEAGYNTSGMYKIRPDGENETEVYCGNSTCGYGAGWTMFQRRINGSVDFYRNWANYSQGFGDKAGEFWLGLDLLHRLTANDAMQLSVELEHGADTTCAHYSNFYVGDATSNYTLNISGFTNNPNDPNYPGDSLQVHNGQPFTTKDRDNDAYIGLNCAHRSQGAWWYRACFDANLNGGYQNTVNKGIRWDTWTPATLQATRMMIKPK